MAVRHLYTHLCEFVVRDSQDKFSYINIIHNVILDRIPGALMGLFIGVGFTAAAGQKFTIALEDPRKKELFRSAEQDVPRRGDRPLDPKIIEVTNGLVLMKPAVFSMEGVHHAVLRVDDRVIHREPFSVVIAPNSSGGKKDAGNS